MMSAPLFAAFSLMTALAVMAVLWPLGRTRALRGAREADLAVYRDQLAEISRDKASGRLPASDAEAARIEVARRILAADAASEGARGADGGRARRRIAAVIALALVPLGAAALYWDLGSPGVPGAPLEARLAAPPDRNDVAILIRRVEEHLAAQPDDGRGYEILAPIYLRVGRPEDAVRAYQQAIRILGATADRQASLGEALTILSNGIVTQDAAAAFKAAVALDASDPRAAYYLGLAAEQDGRKAEAAEIWGRLAASSPPDAPWQPLVRTALARLGSAAPAPPSAPGPSAADVAAAAQMSSSDRGAMVRGMVERLEERLKDNPKDLDGWLRLARSFTVLGDTGKAKAAFGSARAAFADNQEALARIDAAEKDLGLGG